MYNIQLMETILEQQQREKNNELSHKTKDLLNTWRELKHASSNLKRMEYTQLYKKMRRNMIENIKNYNERPMEIATRKQ